MTYAYPTDTSLSHNLLILYDITEYESESMIR